MKKLLCVESCCHFVFRFFSSSQQKLDAKQSHCITYTARLLVHFYLCLRVWFVDSGEPTHLSSHTHTRVRVRCPSACEGWLSRWCITGRSASASSLRRPLRQSASTNHSISQRPLTMRLAAGAEPQIKLLHLQLASLFTYNCHEWKSKESDR